MYLELSLTILVIILLISNYAYQTPSGTLIQQPANVRLPDKVNCSDCLPHAESCRNCPPDCFDCAKKCSANCASCKVDCAKCGPCPPSCQSCLEGPCEPDCQECATGCAINCEDLSKCTLPYNNCLFISRSMTFSLTGYSEYSPNVRVKDIQMTLITSSDKGHIVTCRTSGYIINMYYVDRKVTLRVRIGSATDLTRTIERGSISLTRPTTVRMYLYKTSIRVEVSDLATYVSFKGTLQPGYIIVYVGGILPIVRRRGGGYPSYVGFSGCISDIAINGRYLDATEFELGGDSTFGCPRSVLGRQVSG